MTNPAAWFPEARYGLFIHFGLYSLLGRGEWSMNREEWTTTDYRLLAKTFNPTAFDAEALCDLAVAAGMRYVVFTTMHHDGFRLYKSGISNFSSVTACGRDLTAEVVAAAQKRGLRIGLYHSLNNWMDTPDSVAALEDPKAYAEFIAATHARCLELAQLYPMDTFWFDGWWPFDAEGWQAQALVDKIRAIHPNVLFNPRAGLPGDFATPEGHMGAPQPWRPWEGCISVNDSWGHHVGDHNWKTPGQVIDLLVAAAAGRGNLLLNVSPRPDGSLDPKAIALLQTVGAWLKRNGEAIYPSSHVWSMDLRERGEHRGDWNSHGPCTVTGNALNVVLKRWPGRELILGGFECSVRSARILNGPAVTFSQKGTRVVINLPDTSPDPICSVVRLECDRVPVLYQSGGLRVPTVPHPHYDPCPSELIGAPGSH